MPTGYSIYGEAPSALHQKVDPRTGITEIRLLRSDAVIMTLSGVAVVLGLIMRYRGIGVLVKGFL